MNRGLLQKKAPGFFACKIKEGVSKVTFWDTLFFCTKSISAAFRPASYPRSPLVRACERSTPARFASL